MDEDKAAQLQAQLRVMREAYAAQLPEKIAQIGENWSGLQQDWNPEQFAALHRKVHGLAGSGTTFGFSHLSEAARALEILLKGLIAEGKTPLSRQQCDDVERYLDALRKASFETDETVALPGISGTAAGHQESDRRRIFLVDDDRQLADNLALQIGYFGYEVSVFATLDEARQAIRREAPAVLLLDISFPEDDLGGIRLRKELAELGGAAIPTVFISVRPALEYRLQAVRAGGSAYFTKPVDVAGLIDKLEEITSTKGEEPYRILIVDDSLSLAEYYATVLENAGMETEIVSDPMAVLEPLVEFMPDLILMDIYMPQCSGLDLAKVIRQQERFVSVPIVFLSTESDMDKRLDAMSLGGDDFLAKPIQPEHLVSSMATRVRRSRVLRSFMVRDSLTGLLNHTTLKAQLETQMAHIKRNGGTLAFAMLDIDHFKLVNDTYGHPTGDRVIRSLSRLLHQRLRSSDVVGRYGGEEFAVIFNNTDGATAARVLDTIRRDFSLISHRCEKGEFSVTISAGVADSTRFDDPGTLNEAADRALYEAKRRGRDRVVLSGD